MTQQASTPFDPKFTPALDHIEVQRWPSEMPLFYISGIAAGLLWVVLILSGVGAVYLIFFIAIFGLMRVVMVGQLRGSAVKLGPDQFPELHGAIDTLSTRMRMKTPEAYLMQAGGDLNAFAMRFVRSNIIVLYSDLLTACGDNKAARDMIIAHELGHLKCRHVRYHWFLLPAAFVPLLASALSRAREYTCDRYGLAGAGNAEGAAMGLTILASGGAHAPRVNQRELVRQRETVSRSALMTLAEWFGSHPPLSKRIAQVDPALAGHRRDSVSGKAVLGAIFVGVPLSLFLIFYQVRNSDFVTSFRTALDSSMTAATSEEDTPHVVPADAEQRAHTEIAMLAAFIERERSSRPLPWNLLELKQRMGATGSLADFPVDPFDGADYGYDQRGDHYIVWSNGVDQMFWTDDDIRYDSRVGRIVSGRDTARRP